MTTKNTELTKSEISKENKIYSLKMNLQAQADIIESRREKIKECWEDISYYSAQAMRADRRGMVNSDDQYANRIQNALAEINGYKLSIEKHINEWHVFNNKLQDLLS